MGSLVRVQQRPFKSGVRAGFFYEEIRPELNLLIGGGLVTLERVRVILYRPANVPED